MTTLSKLAIASALVTLAACGGSNEANNTADMNATDMNAGLTDMNTTTDMNATDMNATDMNAGMTDMNATGNTDMNAGNMATNNSM